MSFTLYHYVHCPFCMRVRMAFGFLNIQYTSKVLAYNDEVTPVELTGKKMLPALVSNGKALNESLDIIAFIDTQNILKVKELTNSSDFKFFENFLNTIGNPIHSLAMPYWMYTPEFSPEARVYFQRKKEIKRGSFKELIKNQNHFVQELEPLLRQIENKLQPFYESKTLTLKDILLAAHLWGLYVVPEFQFSEKMHQYLQKIKVLCHFNYHQDTWG